MARIRLPLAAMPQGIGAATPTYFEIPGGYLGDPLVVSPNGVKAGTLLGDPKLQGVTVLVDVPDEDVTNGALDPQKIRQRYPDHFLVRNGIIK